jgi:hypothetical protein
MPLPKTSRLTPFTSAKTTEYYHGWYGNATFALTDWQLNVTGWRNSWHYISKELFCHLFPYKLIVATWPPQVPRARSVRRHAIIAANNSFATTFVLHRFLIRCSLVFFNAFNITLLICFRINVSPVPLKYEHFIYINPMPPFWNAQDIVNYNIHRLLVFREAEGG